MRRRGLLAFLARPMIRDVDIADRREDRDLASRLVSGSHQRNWLWRVWTRPGVSDDVASDWLKFRALKDGGRAVWPVREPRSDA
jgi:hypothetical protein